MAIIKIRKTPKSAFDPDRPAPPLVQAIVAGMQKATRRKIRRPKTEGKAAALLARMTRELRERKPRPASRKGASGARKR